MIISINNRRESQAPAKASSSSAIRKEIEKLGAIKEDLLAEIKEAKKEFNKQIKIKEEIKEAESRLENIELEIKTIQDKIAQYKKIDAEVEKKKQIALDLEQEKEYGIKEYKKSVATLKVELDKLLKNKDKLDQDIKNLKEEKKEQKKEVDKAKKELKKLQQKNMLVAAEISRKIADQNERDEKVINNHEILETMTYDLEQKVAKLRTEQAALEKKNQKLLTEAETIKANAESHFKAKNRDLELISGALSDKESYLKARENFLREVKIKLEEKLGKKIDKFDF